jgi:nucleoside-diphosphate-sugar epimerase
MRIALLGATSQIARDWVLACEQAGDAHRFDLYARRPEAVAQWVGQHALAHVDRCAGFDQFGQHPCDTVVHCVGVGNPATAQTLGASILDITAEFDELALEYIQRHPQVRYIFLSSGAAYGCDFSQPAHEHTRASWDINHLLAQDWYGLAKFQAETRHRVLAHLAITDIRVFSYFSHSQDLAARFFMSDAVRCLREDTILRTAPDDMTRDYCGPDEIHQLINRILAAPACNTAVDLYSLAPIGKFDCLQWLQQTHGLKYEVTTPQAAVQATGLKAHYYSTNRDAARLFGYAPQRNSREVIAQALSQWDLSTLSCRSC